MTDEKPTATDVSQSKLSDIVWQVEHAPSAFTDRWLGKRFDARTALAVPVWLQPWTEAGQSPPEQYTIRDISLSGIGIYAHRAMQIDDMVLARFGINSTCWSGPMRVRHCTETVGGYKIGLEALEETARCPERRTHQSEGLWPKPSSGESLKTRLAREDQSRGPKGRSGLPPRTLLLGPSGDVGPKPDPPNHRRSLPASPLRTGSRQTQARPNPRGHGNDHRFSPASRLATNAGSDCRCLTGGHRTHAVIRGRRKSGRTRTRR